jgi:hypothetical protein
MPGCSTSTSAARGRDWRLGAAAWVQELFGDTVTGMNWRVVGHGGRRAAGNGYPAAQERGHALSRERMGMNALQGLGPQIGDPRQGC